LKITSAGENRSK